MHGGQQRHSGEQHPAPHLPPPLLASPIPFINKCSYWMHRIIHLLHLCAMQDLLHMHIHLHRHVRGSPKCSDCIPSLPQSHSLQLGYQLLFWTPAWQASPHWEGEHKGLKCNYCPHRISQPALFPDASQCRAWMCKGQLVALGRSTLQTCGGSLTQWAACHRLVG